MRLSANTASDVFETPLLARAGLILFFLALAGFLIQAWWILYGDPKPGWFSDSVDYLILADFFGGDSARTPESLGFAFFGTSRFPPLFPLLLATGGAGTRTWMAGYWICLTTGMFAIMTSFLWLRQQTGLVFAAAGTIPLAILSPQYFLLHLEIMSESQFVLLMTLTLWLTTLYQKGECSLVLLAFVAGLLPLSRTAGIAMLIALTVWLLWRNTGRTRLVRVIGCVAMWLPSLAWMAYRRLLPIQADYINDLKAAAALHTHSSIVGIGADSVARLVKGFAAWFDLVGAPATQVVAMFVLAVAGYGWWLRLRQWQVDAIFLPVYLGLVLVWPYPAETARLLAVAMPVVALSSWHGMNTMLQNLRKAGTTLRTTVFSTLLILATCTVTAGPTWIDIAERANLKLDPALDSTRRNSAYFLTQPAELAPFIAEVMTRFVELTKAAATVVPKGECVWTNFVTATGYFSELRMIPMQTPVGIVDAQSARQMLSGCNYLIVAALVSPQLELAPLYPLTAIEPISAPVLASYVHVRGKRQLAAALLELRNQPTAVGTSLHQR